MYGWRVNASNEFSMNCVSGRTQEIKLTAQYFEWGMRIVELEPPNQFNVNEFSIWCVQELLRRKKNTVRELHICSSLGLSVQKSGCEISALLFLEHRNLEQFQISIIAINSQGKWHCCGSFESLNNLTNSNNTDSSDRFTSWETIISIYIICMLISRSTSS